MSIDYAQIVAEATPDGMGMDMASFSLPTGDALSRAVQQLADAIYHEDLAGMYAGSGYEPATDTQAYEPEQDDSGHDDLDALAMIEKLLSRPDIDADQRIDLEALRSAISAGRVANPLAAVMSVAGVVASANMAQDAAEERRDRMDRLESQLRAAEEGLSRTSREAFDGEEDQELFADLARQRAEAQRRGDQAQVDALGQQMTDMILTSGTPAAKENPQQYVDTATGHAGDAWDNKNQLAALRAEERAASMFEDASPSVQEAAGEPLAQSAAVQPRPAVSFLGLGIAGGTEAQPEDHASAPVLAVAPLQSDRSLIIPG